MKIEKRSIQYKLFLCFLLILAICTSIGFHQVAAAEPVELIYQADRNYPPLTFSTQTELYGFDPDFANLIFNSIDYKVKYSCNNWSKVFDDIMNGKTDIGGILVVTEERKQKVLFTDILLYSSVSVYTRNTYRNITIRDLDKITVGVGKRYYTESILKNELGITDYVTYEDLSQAIDDLVNGKIDAIFEDHWLMDGILVASRQKGAITAQINDLYRLPQAYAVNRNKPELVKYMNQRIRQLKKNGVYEELYMKYFYSHSDYYLESKRKNNIMIISSVLAGTILLLLLIRIYINMLKQKLSTNYINLQHANNELAAVYEELQSQYEEIEINRKELAESEERYRLIAEGANDGLWDWDIIHDQAFISDKWAKKIGMSKEQVSNFSAHWNNAVDKEIKAELHEYFLLCQHSENNDFIYEFQWKTEESETLWVLIKAKIVRDDNGRIIRMAGSISDINEKKNHENAIHKLAYYDYLTDIPNRVMLNDKLSRLIRVAAEFNYMAALYYVDLDNFKHINDTLGHEYGDMLLKAVARELLKLKENNYDVFRVGGDEFIIIISDVKSREEAKSWADRILSLIRKDWSLPDGETYVSASIGITLIPEDGIDYQKILKSADTAMYEAKEEGKGNYRFFHEDMLSKVRIRSEMEINLRKAIEKEEFEIYYQPYYFASDGRIAGIEALIRWFHPMMGCISPAVFIPVAEETGLIKEIGSWVLKNVCRQNKEWQERGLPRVPIAVNVTEIQLEDCDFITELQQNLSCTQLDPQYLHIEITESSIMKSISKSIDILKSIRKLGIEISLDDFGTGYSSLNYLQHLPIDTVKIDKCFIDEILNRRDEALILSEIISIAHKLKMNVIAEGVEEKEQYFYLNSKKCDCIQGYYFSVPLPKTRIEELLLQAV